MGDCPPSPSRPAGSRLISGGQSLSTKAEHYGQLNVVTKDRRDETAEAAIAARLRDRFAAIPDLVAKHGKPTYFSLKTPSISSGAPAWPSSKPWCAPATCACVRS